MPTVITGTDGINQVQAGAVESGDLASGAIGSGDLPAGSVIQVVQEVYTSSVAITSSSFVATGLVISITPLFSSSKILIMGHFDIEIPSNIQASFTLRRNGSNITQGNGFQRPFSDNNRIIIPVAFQHLDEPNTNQVINYEIFARSSSSTTEIGSQATEQRLVAMEIAG